MPHLYRAKPCTNVACFIVTRPSSLFSALLALLLPVPSASSPLVSRVQRCGVESLLRRHMSNPCQSTTDYRPPDSCHVCTVYPMHSAEHPDRRANAQN